MGLFGKENKFGPQITQEAYRLMGANPDETTEAELHQMMVDAKSFDENQEVKAVTALKAELDKMKAELQTANDAKATAEQTTTAKETELKAAETERDENAVKLQTANEALAAKVKECNTLAGEVARLTAGKKPGEAAATDTDEQLERSPAGNGQSLNAAWLSDSLLGSAKN